jgi:DnaJ-class molecular chaperone
LRKRDATMCRIMLSGGRELNLPPYQRVHRASRSGSGRAVSTLARFLIPGDLLEIAGHRKRIANVANNWCRRCSGLGQVAAGFCGWATVKCKACDGTGETPKAKTCPAQ